MPSNHSRSCSISSSFIGGAYIIIITTLSFKSALQTPAFIMKDSGKAILVLILSYITVLFIYSFGLTYALLTEIFKHVAAALRPQPRPLSRRIADSFERIKSKMRQLTRPKQGSSQYTAKPSQLVQDLKITRLILLQKKRRLLPDRYRVIVEYSDKSWKLSMFEKQSWMFTYFMPMTIDQYIKQQQLTIMEEYCLLIKLNQTRFKQWVEQNLLHRKNITDKSFAFETMQKIKLV